MMKKLLYDIFLGLKAPCDLSPMWHKSTITIIHTNSEGESPKKLRGKNMPAVLKFYP